MSSVLIPEWFGCGNKLSYFEALSLDRLNLVSEERLPSEDGSSFVRAGTRFASSVDKIFQVGLPASTFAQLALRHAIADLVCSGSGCDRVDVCFEFSNSSSESEREELSQAVFQAAKALGVSVGKCHSTFGQATALILAVSGELSGERITLPSHEELAGGSLILSGKLGGLGELYNRALLGDAKRCAEYIDAACRVDIGLTASICGDNAACTDVSGFGLWGAAHTLARRFECELEIQVNSIQHFAERGARVEASCLLARIDEQLIAPAIPERHLPVALMRELCGPILFLSPAKTNLSQLTERLLDAGWDSPHIVGRIPRNSSDGKVVLV